MEQNILKRYNEIHIKLWEEVLKVFSARTNESIEYFRENQEQIEILRIVSLKRTALFNLFVRGQITETEKNNLLMSCDCSACYIASKECDLQYRFDSKCNYCPIEKWRGIDKHRNDYCTLQDRMDNLIGYITKCVDGKEKFNLGAYMSLRKDIMKKMYIIAHLEWGYE